MADKQAYLSMYKHTWKCTCASNYLFVNYICTHYCQKIDELKLNGTAADSHHGAGPGYLWRLLSWKRMKKKNNLKKIKNEKRECFRSQWVQIWTKRENNNKNNKTPHNKSKCNFWELTALTHRHWFSLWLSILAHRYIPFSAWTFHFVKLTEILLIGNAFRLISFLWDG